jgi:hypothetical protein
MPRDCHQPASLELHFASTEFNLNLVGVGRWGEAPGAFKLLYATQPRPPWRAMTVCEYGRTGVQVFCTPPRLHTALYPIWRALCIHPCPADKNSYWDTLARVPSRRYERGQRAPMRDLVPVHQCPV